ncbi:hypothetical protein Tco_0341640 [Tanacetum coccineum]
MSRYAIVVHEMFNREVENHYTLDVQRMSQDAIVVHEMFNGGVEMLSLYIRCSTDESVESIPLTFDSEEHYFGSFVYPLLEETRSELATSIKVMDTAPFADILSSIECTRGENILYDVTVGPWENRVKDSRWETRIHF